MVIADYGERNLINDVLICFNTFILGYKHTSNNTKRTRKKKLFRNLTRLAIGPNATIDANLDCRDRYLDHIRQLSITTREWMT